MYRRQLNFCLLTFTLFIMAVVYHILSYNITVSPQIGGENTTDHAKNPEKIKLDIAEINVKETLADANANANANTNANTNATATNAMATNATATNAKTNAESEKESNDVKKKDTINKKENKVDESEKLIKGLKFSSNTGLDPLASEYSSRYAALDSKGAWGGNPQLKYFTYLEILLPDFYHVTGIITAGNEDLREWVTEFYIEYWDNYGEIWNKYDKVFNANTDDKTFIVNRLDVNTTKIRIFPVSWQTYPSMRVGLMGNLATFSECNYYQNKMDKGDDGQKEYYTKLYDAKCKKIDIEVYKSKEDELIAKENELKIISEKLASKDKELASKNKELASKDQELNEFRENYCPKQQLVDLAMRYKASKSK